MLLAAALSGAPARAQVGLHAATHLGIGSIDTGRKSAPYRSLGTFNLEAMPGWRFSPKLMAGLVVDYRLITQLEDGTGSNAANFGGKGLTLGLGGTFETGDAKFLVSYDPFARHWAPSPQTTYKGSGFHIMAGIQFEPKWFIDVEFSSATYDEAGIRGLDQHLRDPRTHWNLALGVSYSY